MSNLDQDRLIHASLRLAVARVAISEVWMREYITQTVSRHAGPATTQLLNTNQVSLSLAYSQMGGVMLLIGFHAMKLPVNHKSRAVDEICGAARAIANIRHVYFQAVGGQALFCDADVVSGGWIKKEYGVKRHA
jgi:hypothetical protein